MHYVQTKKFGETWILSGVFAKMDAAVSAADTMRRVFRERAVKVTDSQGRILNEGKRY